MPAQVIILGCGPSAGVPIVGNEWGRCDPLNPKNKRKRSSVLLKTQEGQHILFDTGPDLRVQLLDNYITHVDAVVYTHAHADHIFGMDDLRQLYYLQKRPIQIYADAKTLNILRRCYPYMFEVIDPLYKTFLDVNEIKGPFNIGDYHVIPFFQEHSSMGSLGHRIGDFAYCTDFKTLDDKAIDILKGVETWVVEALREEPHPAHSHLDNTLNLIDHIKPKHAILTHMNYMLDYDYLKNRLPSYIEPAYDGLTIDVELR